MWQLRSQRKEQRASDRAGWEGEKEKGNMTDRVLLRGGKVRWRTRAWFGCRVVGWWSRLQVGRIKKGFVHGVEARNVGKTCGAKAPKEDAGVSFFVARKLWKGKREGCEWKAMRA